MNILDQIIAHKVKEVAERKSLFPEKLLEQSVYFKGTPVSMKKYILRDDKSGIIAEFKRKSPSKGVINQHVGVERTSIGYMQAGASALSIITDKDFFGGKNEDLTIARRFNFCPILRKDFIVDEYQVIESKSVGADTILLIAAALKPERIMQLAQLAKSFGMEVLLEVHNLEELRNNLDAAVDLIGVNNRDLSTFETNIEHSIKLSEHIPSEFVKVSESGLHDAKIILELKKYGYRGFLIGEAFMKNARPERACASLIEEIKKAEKENLSVRF